VTGGVSRTSGRRLTKSSLAERPFLHDEHATSAFTHAKPGASDPRDLYLEHRFNTRRGAGTGWTGHHAGEPSPVRLSARQVAKRRWNIPAGPFVCRGPARRGRQSV